MNYQHLTIEERICIRKYYVDGLSYRKIAKLVGRKVSTISREIHTANYEELRDLEEREKRKEKEHGRE